MDAAHNAMHAAGQGNAGGSLKPGNATRPTEPLSLEHALGRLWDELRGLLHDHLLLATLESRQALAALVRVLFLAAMGAALLLGAWAAVMTAAVMWLLDTGLSIAVALALVAGGTFALSVALFLLARQSVREVPFPATLRRLANAPLPRSPE